MGNNTANITVGKPKSTGAVFYAPAGSTLPTTADAELDTAFVCVGTISDDGLTRKTKKSTKEIKDWGGNTVKVMQTDITETFGFTMLEATNADVRQDMNVEDEYYKAIEDRDTAILQREKALKKANEQLQQRDEQLQQRDEQLQQRDEQLQQRDEQLQQRDEQLQQRDEQLKHMARAMYKNGMSEAAIASANGFRISRYALAHSFAQKT